MSKTSIARAILVAALAGAFSVPALAQRGPDGRCGGERPHVAHPEHDFPPPFEAPRHRPPPVVPPGVTLSPAQEDRVFELHHALVPKERELLKASRAAGEALRDLVVGDRFDATRARPLAQAQAAAMADLMVLRAEFDAKVRALLSPEQRKQQDEARARFRKEKTNSTEGAS